MGLIYIFLVSEVEYPDNRVDELILNLSSLSVVSFSARSFWIKVTAYLEKLSLDFGSLVGVWQVNLSLLQIKNPAGYPVLLL